MHGLHGMYLAVLQARKTREDKSCRLGRAGTRTKRTDTYPWHQIQVP